MSRAVRSTTRKRKTTGYESVERIVMPVLKYAGHGTKEDKVAYTDHRPIREIRYDPVLGILIGAASCGDTAYFCTSKEEAEVLIDFIKKCYCIE